MMPDTNKILIAMTSIAMNLPSAYTISWSIHEHPEQVKNLFVGLGLSGVTVLGAFVWDPLMWLGFIGSLIFFGWIIVSGVPRSAPMEDWTNY